MTTRTFAVDKKGKKIYIGTIVEYKKEPFFIENMNMLSWNREQYLTLRSKKNKNKTLEFITPKDVFAKH